MTSLAHELAPYLAVAIPVVVTLVLTWLLALLVGLLIGRLMRDSTPQVTVGARRIAAVIVWLVGGTLALQELGLSPDVLLLVIGLLGVAVVLSVWEPLRNYGAKYFADIYTPFKIGDIIEVEGHAGKVIEINAMTTVLLGENEHLVSVPNATFLRSVVVNTSPFAWKEVNVPISIGGSVDLAEFESQLLKSLAKLRTRLDQRFPPVLTTKSRSPQSSDLVLTLMLRRPEERDALSGEVNRRVAEVIERVRPGRR